MIFTVMMGTAAFILLTAAIGLSSYYYGMLKSDKEWEEKYVSLYKIAVVEIAKAKGLSVGDIEQYMPKPTKPGRKTSKSRPTLSIVKDKGDGDETGR